jgi:hypothetical protein
MRDVAESASVAERSQPCPQTNRDRSSGIFGEAPSTPRIPASCAAIKSSRGHKARIEALPPAEMRRRLEFPPKMTVACDRIPAFGLPRTACSSSADFATPTRCTPPASARALTRHRRAVPPPRHGLNARSRSRELAETEGVRYQQRSMVILKSPGTSPGQQSSRQPWSG